MHDPHNQVVSNGYIRLCKEKLHLKFNQPNSSIYFDDITQKFIICTIDLNRTRLTAKTNSNIELWTIEIPGNATITSVKISPHYDIVAIQRSSYYVEFVVVTLSEKKQQLFFQTSSCKKNVINNFFWPDNSHVVFVTSSGIELYELCPQLTLKLIDKTSVECEWQRFHWDPIHYPLLIVGQNSQIHLFLFKDCAKLDQRRTLNLIRPCLLSSNGITNKYLTTKFNNLSSSNIKLTVIYKILYLIVYGVDEGFVYIFKIADMCCLTRSKSTCDHSYVNNCSKYFKPHPTKNSFDKTNSFIFRYPVEFLPPNSHPHKIDFLFNDDLIYLIIINPQKLIYSYDISLMMSYNCDSHENNSIIIDTNSLINPIDYLFTSCIYNNDKQNHLMEHCKLSETEGNFFPQQDHIIFLQPNILINSSKGTLWLLLFNVNYFIQDCSSTHQPIVIQLLQRRADCQKYILQLFHETLVIKDCSLDLARRLIDTIVIYNIAAAECIEDNKHYEKFVKNSTEIPPIDNYHVNESNVSPSYQSSLSSTSTDVTNKRKFKFSQLILPENYLKSQIRQENLFATVFLPLMADNIYSGSRQKMRKNYMLKTLLLHFINQLSRLNIPVEGFLYETIIELMVKLNNIFQLKQLYQCGLIPKRCELGTYLLGYCHQYPSLTVIAMDMLIEADPIQFVQLLLDNRYINEAVRKYTRCSNQTTDNDKIIDSIIDQMENDKTLPDNVYFSIFNWLKTHMNSLNIDSIPTKLIAQFKLRFGIFYN